VTFTKIKSVPLESELAEKGWLVRIGTTFDVSGHSNALRVTFSHLVDGQAARLRMT